MLFAAEHSADLKAWLAKELEPICEADPEVLSDYIMALLKHDGSMDELENLLKDQLSDFLAEQTASFVSKALDALRNKTYLPALARPSAPDPEHSNSRKRRAADDEHDDAVPNGDDGDGAPAAKASRSSDVGLPRGPRAGTGAGGVPLNGRAGLPAQPGRGPKGRDGRPRELCRSYHQKGFCPRGDECRYEHSTDMLTAGGPGFGGVANGGGGMMAGPGGAPIHLGGPQMGMGRPPQGMVPTAPGFMPGPPFGGPFQGMQQGWNGGVMQGGPLMQGQQQQQNGGVGGGGGSSDAEGSGGPGLAARLGGHPSSSPTPHGSFGQPGDMMMMTGPGPSRGGHMGGGPGDGAGRGGRGGGMRGGGRGAQGTFRQAKSSTTLVIENVPQDSLDLIKVNEYFKRFGTITNIQIDHQGSKALVSYSRPEEAKTAHSSPEAVFGNRFIKVFFQRLDEGPSDGAAQQQQQQQRPTPTGAVAPPPKSNFIPGVTSNVYHARPPVGGAGPSSATSAGGTVPNPARAKAMEEQRAAQKRVDALMDEQRKLMASVTGSEATAEVKKEAMARLKVIGPEFDKAKEEAKEAAQRAASLPATIPRPTGGGEAGDAAKRQEQREQMERAKLDRELELHTKSEAASSSNEELQAKLASLKAEAEALGIDPSAPQAAPIRGGFRGRARATFRGGPVRGGYGGFRGGAPRGSMSLDNRSTRISVAGLPEGSEEKRETTKAWLKQFGEVESFSDSTDASGLVVTFKQRAFGEAAMRSAADVPGVGSVKLSWAPAAASVRPTASVAASGGAADAQNSGAESVETPQGEGGQGHEEGEEGEGEQEGEGEEEDRDWRR